MRLIVDHRPSSGAACHQAAATLETKQGCVKTLAADVLKNNVNTFLCSELARDSLKAFGFVVDDVIGTERFGFLGLCIVANCRTFTLEPTTRLVTPAGLSCEIGNPIAPSTFPSSSQRLAIQFRRNGRHRCRCGGSGRFARPQSLRLDRRQRYCPAQSFCNRRRLITLPEKSSAIRSANAIRSLANSLHVPWDRRPKSESPLDSLKEDGIWKP